MAEREIMREYLARLGFAVDEPSFRKFMLRMDGSKKEASKLSLSLLGIVIAGEAAVTAFARAGERVYYQSQRVGASAANIKALEFGFGQIGLRAEDAAAAIESIAATTRNNPGLDAMLKRFTGGETDPTRQLTALIRELKKMPYFVGSQWAQLFGISEQTFRMLTAPGALEKLTEAEDRQRSMMRAMGVDADAAARSSKEYMNILRDLWMQVGVVSDAFLIKMLPAFKDVNQFLGQTLYDLAHVDFANLTFDLPTITGFLYEQAGGWQAAARGVSAMTEELTRFALGKGLSDRMWKEYGEIMAFIMGGPNWRNGGRRDGGLFPPGTPGYDAAGRAARGERPPMPVLPAPARPAAPAPGDFPRETDAERIARARLQLEKLSDEGGSPVEEARLRGLIEKLQGGRSGWAPAGGAGVGPLSMIVNSRTEINVHGTDPESTGRAVEKAQERTHRDLADVIRDTAPAVT